MSTWTPADLAAFDAADEVGVAPAGADGTTGAYVAIWVVRVGDEVYVRSYHGRAGRWFQRALQQREGHARVRSVDWNVTFNEPADADHEAIDAAYRRKYGRHGPTYVDAMVTGTAAAATLRLMPRSRPRRAPPGDRNATDERRPGHGLADGQP